MKTAYVYRLILTLAAEKELQAYTAQKQAEINRTWSK